MFMRCKGNVEADEAERGKLDGENQGFRKAARLALGELL